MKMKNSKSISFLFIIVVVISIMFTLLYHTINSYRGYIDRKHSIENIVLIDKIDCLINKIDEEKLHSAIYLGTENKNDLNKVIIYRELVDLDIKDVISFLDKNGKLSHYKQSIKNIFKNLNYTRSRVDMLNIDYRGTLFNRYLNKVTKPLLQLLDKMTKNTSMQESSRFYYYMQLYNLKENLNMEKIFISFILSSSKKMSDGDLYLWDKFLQNDMMPNFYTKLDDVMTIARLHKIMNVKNFSDITETLRAKIFMNSVDGRYSTSISTWIKRVTKKINKVETAQKLLLSEVKKGLKSQLSNLKDRTLNLILISFANLILLFTLIYLFRNNIRNNRLLVDTLKDIEADLDENQKMEIKKVLKKNDIIEIYKFLANAIKEPSRAKDYFLANMSHEIRTPLNGIIGFTNILKETQLKEDQKEFLNIIEESSNNLINIVNDILDFSKASSGKIEFENIPFNVMEKFEATIDSYSAKAAQKNINLELFIDPTLPIELIGDATKISQIVINLLSNAIKFTDEYGTVSVTIEKVSEIDDLVTIKFAIKDSGIGITNEQQSKIFDAFSQADASTSRKFGGTGLGLTISSKFVSLMGGKLEVQSKENDGASFFFSINMHKPIGLQERVKPNLENIRVAYIVLKDNIKIDNNLKRYVEYLGARFEKYSYKEILNIKTKSLPNIIFIDHQYIKDEKIISSISNLGTKVVLISTAEIESCNCSIKDNLSKVLYKPLNYSKTLRALKLVNDKSIFLEEKITKVNDKKLNKAFKNINALVVEDNTINQKLIKNILNNFGITVTVASDGLEGFNLRKKREYDIIFMDIQMPIMSGVEATEKILEYEKDTKNIHVPIIALTANVITGDREKYLSAGMDRYLKKPIDVEELTAILEEYFPINDIRDSIPLDNQNRLHNHEQSKIILYKETALTAKIYSAVLNNLGYKVDMYSSEDEFLEHLDNDYKFALFDVKPFQRINSDVFVINLIKDSGATPIAFVDNDEDSSSCETLRQTGNINEISQKLEKCG